MKTNHNKKKSVLHKALLVALINKTGNVGKTTIGSCMIAPRLPNLELMAYIENTNHIPNQLPEPVGVVYGAHEFGEVEAELLDAKMNGKSAIVDFGASDFNTTIDMLSQYTALKDKVDVFIVPCTSGNKLQVDTAVTIDTLIGLGIPPEKIRVLFNQVPLRDKPNLHRLFSGIFKLQAQTLEQHGSTFFAVEDATMFQAEIFKRLSDLGVTLAEMLEDDTDYEAAILAEPNKEKKFALAGRMSIKGLADNTDKTFDRVFDALMAGV